jgi:Spy/CpxP family protein refolding chaperone
MKASLLAAVALCAAAIASAQPPNPPTPQQKAAWEAKRMDRLALLLDLSSAQKSEVQMILETERTKARAAFAQLKSSGTPPTREQIKALRTQIKTDTDSQLSGVLSPLQVQKFNALHQGFGGPRFRHHRHGPLPGSAPPSDPGTQN